MGAFLPLLQGATQALTRPTQQSGQAFAQGLQAGEARRVRQDAKAVDAARRENMLTLRDLTESGVSDAGIRASFGGDSGSLQRAQMDLRSFQNAEVLEQAKVGKAVADQRKAEMDQAQTRAVNSARLAKEAARQLRRNPAAAGQIIEELAQAGVYRPSSMDEVVAITQDPSQFIASLESSSDRALARFGELPDEKLRLSQDRMDAAAELFNLTTERDMIDFFEQNPEKMRQVDGELALRREERQAFEIRKSRAHGADAAAIGQHALGKAATNEAEKEFRANQTIRDQVAELRREARPEFFGVGGSIRGGIAEVRQQLETLGLKGASDADAQKFLFDRQNYLTKSGLFLLDVQNRFIKGNPSDRDQELVFKTIPNLQAGNATMTSVLAALEAADRIAARNQGRAGQQLETGIDTRGAAAGAGFSTQPGPAQKDPSEMSLEEVNRELGINE